MNISLNRYVLTLLFAASTTCICLANQPPSHGAPNKSDVKWLLKNAHTPAEFNQVAAYFDQRSNALILKAAEEDQELDRLRKLTFRTKNYPNLVDQARNNASYDRLEARKCAAKAKAFRSQAEAAAVPSAELARQNG